MHAVVLVSLSIPGQTHSSQEISRSSLLFEFFNSITTSLLFAEVLQKAISFTFTPASNDMTSLVLISLHMIPEDDSKFELHFFLKFTALRLTVISESLLLALTSMEF